MLKFLLYWYDRFMLNSHWRAEYRDGTWSPWYMYSTVKNGLAENPRAYTGRVQYQRGHYSCEGACPKPVTMREEWL